MPHVSKKKLKQKTFLKINDLLLDSLFPSASHNAGKSILKDLLTKTERVMLAKRLTMIVLINKGYSPYRITKILKVSSSTVARMIDHSMITPKISKNSSQSIDNGNFWDKLEKFILLGLPPYVPHKRSDRWKFLDKY